MKIVKLEKIEKKFNLNNDLYALIGGENPTGSIKDVTVFGMLNSYKKEGKLKPNATVIEATSGNTGISLAYYQKEFNYKALIVMPKSMSVERRNKIAKFGAELCLIDGGMRECEEKATLLSKEIENSFVFSQFDSPYNPQAHYDLTAPFIYEKTNDIDYLVAGIGTGGTITGTAKYLKERLPDIKIIGVEPFESPLLTKHFAAPHLIQGIGANFIPSILDQTLLDDVMDVSGKQSIELAKTIRTTELLDVGYSSGACLLGAIDFIKKVNPENKKFLLIFPDKGDRYEW